MGAKENAVTKALREYLTLKGAKVVRVQAGMMKIGKGPAARVMRLAEAGTADLLGVYKGQAIAVEAKTATGRQSDTQRAFQQAWEKAGGKYVVARSVADLEGL